MNFSYLFCVLRIFLPIEFPGLQIVLMDNTVYTSVVDVFVKRDDNGMVHPNMVFYIVMGVWILGILVQSLWALISQHRFRRYLMANGDYATDHTFPP